MIKQEITKSTVSRKMTKTEFLGLVDLAKSVLNAKKEYAIVKEQEETKRASISCDLTKYLAKLNAQKEILGKHLENEFQLRKETIDEIFARLDTAVDNNNDVVAAAALKAISVVVSTNPLSGVAEIHKLFEDDDSVIEI